MAELSITVKLPFCSVHICVPGRATVEGQSQPTEAPSIRVQKSTWPNFCGFENPRFSLSVAMLSQNILIVVYGQCELSISYKLKDLTLSTSFFLIHVLAVGLPSSTFSLYLYIFRIYKRVFILCHSFDPSLVSISPLNISSQSLLSIFRLNLICFSTPLLFC